MDWEKWKKQQISRDEMREKSHCGTTARHIITLLTGIEITKYHSSSLVEGKEVPFSNEQVYSDDFDKFIQIKESDFVEEIAQKLFSSSIKSEKSEHLLFYVTLFGSTHTFVIEKKSDGTKTWWRIYQSWQESFTLADWLGEDRWINEPCRDEFTQYGAGKLINTEQLLLFLKNMYTLCAKTAAEYYHPMFGSPIELRVIMFNLLEVKTDL